MMADPRLASAPVPEVRDVRFIDLDAATLHEILRLRNEVFVVEQQSPFHDIDGRDAEPTTRHIWLDDGGQVVSYLRVVTEPGRSARVGRVATRHDRRSQGHAARLMRAVTASIKGALVLDAQSHLATWYERYGFRTSGPEFDEDGVAHVPMRRPAVRAASAESRPQRRPA